MLSYLLMTDQNCNSKIKQLKIEINDRKRKNNLQKRQQKRKH